MQLESVTKLFPLSENRQYLIKEGESQLVSLMLFVYPLLVKEMHDIGNGGGCFFISLIPCLGDLIFLIFTIQKGECEANRFGEPSKPLCDSAA